MYQKAFIHPNTWRKSQTKHTNTLISQESRMLPLEGDETDASRGFLAGRGTSTNQTSKQMKDLNN